MRARGLFVVLMACSGVALAKPKTPPKPAPSAPPAAPAQPVAHEPESTFGPGSICFLVCVGIPVIIYSVSQSNARRKRERDYRTTLAALAQSPGDNGLRQRALALGRTYYGGLRKGGRPTVYDETAIGNDINSCLGAPGGPARS